MYFQVPQAQRGRPVLLDQLGHPDLKVHVVNQVQEGNVENQAFLLVAENVANLVYLGRVVNRVHVDFLGFRDHKDKEVCQGRQEHLVVQAQLGKWDLRALRVLLVCLDQVERQEIKVNQAYRDLLDQEGRLVLMEHLVRICINSAWKTHIHILTQV